MKYLISVAVLVGVSLAFPRVKRGAYELPDGVEIIVGPIKTTFSCQGLGYYGDVDNNCKIFHVCNPVIDEDGVLEMQHYSFMCGNQTVFNQFTMTCTSVDEAVPCGSSADFYRLNDRIGKEDVDFLQDDDVERANNLIRARQ